MSNSCFGLIVMRVIIALIVCVIAGAMIVGCSGNGDAALNAEPSAAAEGVAEQTAHATANSALTADAADAAAAAAAADADAAAADAADAAAAAANAAAAAAAEDASAATTTAQSEDAHGQQIALDATVLPFAAPIVARAEGEELSEAGKIELIEAAKGFLTAIVSGQFSACIELFDDAMKAEMPEEALIIAWNSIAMKAGHFESITREEYAFRDGMDVVVLVSNHTLRGVVSTIVFSPDKKVSGLRFIDTDLTSGPGGQNQSAAGLKFLAALPDTVVEEDVIISGDPRFPLAGKLTLPKNSVAGGFPAVVLVHGLEPPQDMDATIGANKPFRDIAWALAEKGVAVIRYDKRAYSYGGTMSEVYGTSLTVKEDIIDDAVHAKNLLVSDNRINGDAILVAGHYLGGMLAPRILDEGGFAGAIIMAGSPRSLIDTILYQIEYEMGSWGEGDEDAYVQQLVNETQYEAYLSLETESEEDVKDTIIFGINGYYIREMDRHKTSGYFDKISEPILILQGAKDIQVSHEHDFGEYRRLAEGHNNIALKSYADLNHLFIRSDMDKPDRTEYLIPGTVADEVIDDIANWITENYQ